MKEEVIERFRDEMVLPAVRDYLVEVFGDQAAKAESPAGWMGQPAAARRLATPTFSSNAS